MFGVTTVGTGTVAAAVEWRLLLLALVDLGVDEGKSDLLTQLRRSSGIRPMIARRTSCAASSRISLAPVSVYQAACGEQMRFGASRSGPMQRNSVYRQNRLPKTRAHFQLAFLPSSRSGFFRIFLKCGCMRYRIDAFSHFWRG